MQTLPVTIKKHWIGYFFIGGVGFGVITSGPPPLLGPLSMRVDFF